MSTLTTPRSGTQTTNRSRTHSVLPNQEPKTKQSSRAPERGPAAANNETAGKEDVTSRSVEEYDVQPKQEAATSDLPFFKQDQFTDVVLQVEIFSKQTYDI